MGISAKHAASARPRRSRILAPVLLVAFVAGGYPLYAAAQAKPVAGKKTPPKKKKKGEPADSASASASAPPTPPPPPEPEPTASATASAPPEVASVASAAPPPPPPPAPESQPGAWKRTAGWVSIGAGALFLGGGFLFYKLDKGLNDKAGYHAYARAVGPSQDVCDAAKSGLESGYTGALSASDMRSLCSKGKTYFIAELASFGLGVVGVGLGVYWLVTAPAKEKPASSWTLLPRVGSSPGIDFAMRF